MKVISLIRKALPEFEENAQLLKNAIGGGGKIYWKSVMAWNLLRYGARPIDYVRFEFYRKSAREKNRYMTIYRYFSMVKRLYKEVQKELRGDKIGEYEYFKKFIKRQWIVVTKGTDETVVREFIARHGVVIAKPNHGEQGKGVMKISAEDSASIEELLKLRCDDDYVVEECLTNTPEINVINPSSLNTVRVFTFIDNKQKIRILAVMLRVGSPGAHVDNWGSGGVAYSFDVETGICDCKGKDKMNRPYIFHPGSDVQMLGFKLPGYDELKKYIRELCNHAPSARFVGWDVAITPDGFDLVEMNCPGGHDICQVFDNPVYDILTKNW